jgi:hypothetical protein
MLEQRGCAAVECRGACVHTVAEVMHASTFMRFALDRSWTHECATACVCRSAPALAAVARAECARAPHALRPDVADSRLQAEREPAWLSAGLDGIGGPP